MEQKVTLTLTVGELAALARALPQVYNSLSDGARYVAGCRTQEAYYTGCEKLAGALDQAVARADLEALAG